MKTCSWLIALLPFAIGSVQAGETDKEYLITCRTVSEERSPSSKRPPEQAVIEAPRLRIKHDKQAHLVIGSRLGFPPGKSDDDFVDTGTKLDALVTRLEDGRLRLKAALSRSSGGVGKDGTVTAGDERIQFISCFKPGETKRLFWKREQSGGKTYERHLEVTLDEVDASPDQPAP